MLIRIPGKVPTTLYSAFTLFERAASQDRAPS